MRTAEERSPALASVVIPAHNEARTIARSLQALRSGISPTDLDVVVVCNGCTDDTADAARAADPSARVVELPQPSKSEAVRLGNTLTTVFPRIHLDADVEISGRSLLGLLGPLDDGFLAAAPERVVPREGVSRWVAWYYDVWEELPHVRSSLFGRGVVALSREGQERVSALPQVMGDDLVMSDAFTDDERCVVADAVVVVRPPKTVSDLLRRRVRVATGNHQADSRGLRRDDSRTDVGGLFRLLRKDPRLAPRMLVFGAVTAVARVRAKRAVRAQDFGTWQRDESSRS